jgi:putative DNA primase/helicase
VDYVSGADCSLFKKFLKEILIDEAVIKFVKRYAGYTLTGSTRERLLAILYGYGKNGKSTLVELLQDVLGDYATNTDTETLLAKRYQGVGNDIAALKGARFVSAAEIEKGRRLAESKVKQLTGSDTVTARYLFGEPFNFRPEFKLWISSNNKPEIQGTDDAIWDRIRLIPFTQRFEGERQDTQLPEELRKEMPGIFAWMVSGCLEWLEHGLGEPEKIAKATKEYREEMDTLAAFFEDCCVEGEEHMVPATRLYKRYQFWCDNAGEKRESQKAFGMRMRERGFVSERIKTGPYKGYKGYFDIGLRGEHPDPEEPNDGAKGSPSADHSVKDRPLQWETGDDPLPGENPSFAGKSRGVPVEGDDRRPLNQNLQGKNPREEKVLEKRSPSSPAADHADDGDLL